MTNIAEQTGYIIDPAWGRERERLRLMSKIADSWTIGRLDQLGVAAGWHCLDVGAGNGSVAAWLADRVGPLGRSVASDIDTRFLGEVAEQGVEVLRHDVLADEFPDGSFDLVHARAVLMHVAEPERAIARMLRWLRPGGTLLLEDAEGLAAAFAVDPVWSGLWAALERFPALDVHCGRKLPSWLTDAGMTDVAAEGWVPTVRGGSPIAEWYLLTIDSVAEPLEAAGVWSRNEIDAVRQRLADPAFLDFSGQLISCSGRRPR